MLMNPNVHHLHRCTEHVWIMTAGPFSIPLSNQPSLCFTYYWIAKETSCLSLMWMFTPCTWGLNLFWLLIYTQWHVHCWFISLTFLSAPASHTQTHTHLHLALSLPLPVPFFCFPSVYTRLRPHTHLLLCCNRCSSGSVMTLHSFLSSPLIEQLCSLTVRLLRVSRELFWTLFIFYLWYVRPTSLDLCIYLFLVLSLWL